MKSSRSTRSARRLAESETTSAESRRVILDYIESHGVMLKDSGGAAPKKQNRPAGQLAPSRRIDLHGMLQAQAAPVLRNAVLRCRRQGGGRLLVIHGYGLHAPPGQPAGVLKALVRQMLEGELRRMVRDWKTAPLAEGGDGATVVVVKAGKA